MNNNKQSFLTPAGAGIVLICFFLPWVNYSCAGEVKNYSGADIGGVTWIVFAAAVIILVAHFLLSSAKNSGLSMPVTLIAAFTGLGVMLFKYMKYADAEKGPAGMIQSIQYGLVLTIIGFALVIIGAFTSRKNNT
jgi:hypothetical protein